MRSGIGSLIGLIIGVLVANWIDSPNNTAYYSIVAFFIAAGTIVTGFFLKKPPTKGQ
jgi:uncharacterized protein YacL